MREYGFTFIVLALLIIAFIVVFYYYNNTIIKGQYTTVINEQNDSTQVPIYNEPINYINSVETSNNNYEKNYTIIESSRESGEEKEKSIFDQDFSRDNKRTEPEITYVNALKLGRWEGDTYINDELGIKIFLQPGWSLHDFTNSFHLNEGSGQVNSAVIKLFSGSISNEYNILKSSNTNIFDIVNEGNKTINGYEYSILNCKYSEKDYFERNVYITNTKMENINIYIETNFYNTNAPFTTRNYELSDIFERF